MLIIIEPLIPIALRSDRDNLYRVEMSGLLRKVELDQCQAQLAAEMRRIGCGR